MNGHGKFFLALVTGTVLLIFLFSKNSVGWAQGSQKITIAPFRMTETEFFHLKNNKYVGQKKIIKQTLRSAEKIESIIPFDSSLSMYDRPKYNLKKGSVLTQEHSADSIQKIPLELDSPAIKLQKVPVKLDSSILEIQEVPSIQETVSVDELNRMRMENDFSVIEGSVLTQEHSVDSIQKIPLELDSSTVKLQKVPVKLDSSTLEIQEMPSVKKNH